VTVAAKSRQFTADKTGKGQFLRGNRSFAPTSRRLNVVVRSPPLYLRGGPKWRDNYPEGPDHPIAPNRLYQHFRNLIYCLPSGRLAP